jgi:hypothetical protein
MNPKLKRFQDYQKLTLELQKQINGIEEFPYLEIT